MFKKTDELAVAIFNSTRTIFKKRGVGLNIYQQRRKQNGPLLYLQRFRMREQLRTRSRSDTQYSTPKCYLSLWKVNERFWSDKCISCTQKGESVFIVEDDICRCSKARDSSLAKEDVEKKDGSTGPSCNQQHIQSMEVWRNCISAEHSSLNPRQCL